MLLDPQEHPISTLVVSGSEDERVRIWHANTNRLESTLRGVSCCTGRRTEWQLAFGFDGGVVVRKLGRDEALYLMDPFV